MDGKLSRISTNIPIWTDFLVDFHFEPRRGNSWNIWDGVRGEKLLGSWETGLIGRELRYARTEVNVLTHGVCG